MQSVNNLEQIVEVIKHKNSTAIENLPIPKCHKYKKLAIPPPIIIELMKPFLSLLNSDITMDAITHRNNG